MALESKYVYTIVAVTIIITFIIIFGLLFAFRNKRKQNIIKNEEYYENYYKKHKKELGISIKGNKYLIDYDDKCKIEFDDDGKLIDIKSIILWKNDRAATNPLYINNDFHINNKNVKIYIDNNKNEYYIDNEYYIYCDYETKIKYYITNGNVKNFIYNTPI